MFKSKNLIVLVGNGFDLAHGLKTSYSNFANYYLEKIIAEDLYEHFYNGTTKSNLIKPEFLANTLNGNKRNDISTRFRLQLKRNSMDLIINELYDNRTNLDKVLKNELFVELYKNQFQNWFNVENVYYQQLMELKRNVQDKSELTEKVIKLNQELEEIKQALKTYLKSLEIPYDENVYHFFLEYFSDAKGLESIYFIVFNYTSTLNQYTTPIIREQSIINPIHGTLSEDIIFGYGNDQSKEYEELRNLEVDELLENFKTYDYMKNSRYIEIYEEAIDAYEDYEVLILGHSLGQTDKTLLEEVLNSEKCKKIHIPKRTDLINDPEKQRKSFNTLVKSASRIISNDRRLRKLVVNFNQAITFPSSYPYST